MTNIHPKPKTMERNPQLLHFNIPHTNSQQNNMLVKKKAITPQPKTT
ncbi:MAG: hypothetical protein ACM3UN_04265 [Bacillota bacterium]